MSASGIPSSRNFSGRKTRRGLALRSAGSNIRRSTGVAPGFQYAGQCVLLMVTTRSYMVSPPDAVAAFPSAEALETRELAQSPERDRLQLRPPTRATQAKPTNPDQGRTGTRGLGPQPLRKRSARIRRVPRSARWLLQELRRTGMRLRHREVKPCTTA